MTEGSVPPETPAPSSGVAAHTDAAHTDAAHTDANPGVTARRDDERSEAERRDAERRSADRRWSQYSTTWANYAQDVVSAAVALILIVLAAALLVAGVSTFLSSGRHLGITLDATDLLDQVLLVLILVEIVHTVVSSLEAHALAAQPFLVVGLVAVIRKILFSLGSEQKLSTTTLALYLGMVAVFVASLIAVEVFTGRRRGPTADEERPRVR